MTAPDDVRARFEAWLAREMNDPEPAKKRNGDYLDPETRNLWLAWQARGADMAGEVRELVEAATEIADNTESWNRAVIEIIGRQPNTGIGTERLRAALAKFTQEKP